METGWVQFCAAIFVSPKGCTAGLGSGGLQGLSEDKGGAGQMAGVGVWLVWPSEGGVTCSPWCGMPHELVCNL